MQQNTESLGSIFDAAPSELTGNIQCLTNPNQPVVGYVSAGTVQQRRIFINGESLPGWNYAYSCGLQNIQVPDDGKDTFVKYFFIEGNDPITQSMPGGPYISNLAGCVDCRLQGGTNVEPSFWPN
jgi:hypothetical protein